MLLGALEPVPPRRVHRLARVPEGGWVDPDLFVLGGEVGGGIRFVACLSAKMGGCTGLGSGWPTNREPPLRMVLKGDQMEAAV